MKKIISLAVLLMTVFVGFTACSDDESDDVKSLSKTTFSTTQHVDDPIKSGDLTYTVSFNNDSECVMRVENRNMKLLNVDVTYNDVTSYGGTYTMNGNTITFNVDCITTEGVATPYSIIDRPQTRTFTYNSDTKVLTTDDGIELSSTNFAHLECKRYAASNDDDEDVVITFDELVGTWGVSLDRSSGKGFVDIYLTTQADGNASLIVNTYNLDGRNKKNYRVSGPIEIGGHFFLLQGWVFFYDYYSDGLLKGISVYDYNGLIAEAAAMSKY